MSSVEKLKALQLTIDKIDKDYGKGTIMRMGEKPTNDVPTIASGSIGIDLALGIGGYPRGRVIEIFGPESSGKTTLAIHAIAPDYFVIWTLFIKSRFSIEENTLYGSRMKLHS